MVSQLFDRLQSLPWTDQYPGRALQNSFTEKWHNKQDEAVSSAEVVKQFEEAKAKEQFDIAHIYAGQIVGLLEKCTTAGDIVRSIGLEAEALLSKRLLELGIS